jgi:hypothetical protein
MDSSVSPKDEIWFLRVCHHISIAAYYSTAAISPNQVWFLLQLLLYLSSEFKPILFTALLPVVSFTYYLVLFKVSALLLGICLTQLKPFVWHSQQDTLHVSDTHILTERVYWLLQCDVSLQAIRKAEGGLSVTLVASICSICGLIKDTVAKSQ